MAVPSAVVAFAGSRDSYQVAVALQEAGLLHRLVNDFYWPPSVPLLDRIADLSGVSRSLKRRSHPDLPGHRVKVVPTAVASVALARFHRKSSARKTYWNRKTDALIGQAARDLALRSGSAVIAYSYYAGSAFRRGGERPRHRFLFQVHPHPAMVRRILREEIERRPIARNSLMAEYELSLSDAECDELGAEAHLANGWVVASEFSATSLVETGIPRDRIHVVPYGVDVSRFPQRPQAPDDSGPLRVIFVGSMIQRKGLSDLLDAARLMGREVHLTLCGRGFVDRQLIEAYPDVKLDIKVNLSLEAIVQELHRSHLFVLPSIAEGFALVILEAMSCGLPVLTTTNTCGPDVIEPGREGWVLPIRAPELIAEKLAWANENRAELAQMGLAAAATARQFHWGRFRQGIRNAYCGMVDSTG